MTDQLEDRCDTAELVAQWHATVEAHIADQLGECVHRLAEAELSDETAHEAPDRGVAHHLAHALMVATTLEGVGSAVKYLRQVAGLLLDPTQGGGAA